MDRIDLESQLPVLIAREWALQVDAVELLSGGMNSHTAAVTTPMARFVAKWVPAPGRADLVRGIDAARVMSDHGIRAGAAVVTTSGARTVPFEDGELALLEDVSGVPLTTSPADQEYWGVALAAVHAAQPHSPATGFYAWLTENAQEPIHPAWVRKAVARVYAEYAQLPPLTWALLHTNPEPEAFLRDPSGDVGVIDWAGSVPGPALYDLASAVMYAGGEVHAQPLLASYERAGVIPAVEIREHLGSLQRLRAGVQADYFSRRLSQDNLTGIDSSDDNVKGLHDAREMLQALGVEVD